MEEPQFRRLAERGRPVIHLVIDGRSCEALAGEHAVDRTAHQWAGGWLGGVRRRAACRILPDGCVPGLLGRTGRRHAGCAPARASSSTACGSSRGVTPTMSDKPPVIVGAGPAGIRAAATLAAAGLAPVVIDEAPKSGGQIYRRAPDGFTRPYPGYLRFRGGEGAPAARGVRRRRRQHRLSAGYAGLGPAARCAALPVGRAKRGDVVSRRHPGAWRARPYHPLSGLDSARRLHAGRRADRLEAPRLRRRRANCLHGHGTSALPRRLPVREGGCRDRRRAEHLTVRRKTSRPARPAARWADVRQGPVVRGGAARPRHRHGKRHPAGRGRGEGRRCLRVCLSRFGGHGNGGLPAMRSHSASVSARRHSSPISRKFHSRGIPCSSNSCRSATSPAARPSPVSTLQATGAVSPAPTPQSSAASAQLSRFSRIAAITWDKPRLAVLERALLQIAGLRVTLETAFPFPVDIAAGMSDETILCRCEGVTAGEFRRTAVGLHAGEINRAKAFSRCGMGRCQGRVCGPAAAVVLAAALGAPTESIGRLRSQPPVKPIPMAVVT